MEQLMANLPENRKKGSIRRSLDAVEKSEGDIMTPRKKKGINYERPWRAPPTVARVNGPKSKATTEDASSMVGNNHLYSEDNTTYNQKRIDYLTEMRNKR